MNRYDRYKDSGIPWLGEVPEHWEIKHSNQIFKIHNGATPKTSEPDYWGDEIAWFTPKDLGDNKNKEIAASLKMITKEGYENCGVSLAPAKSIALSKRAPIGHLAITLLPAVVNQGCFLLEVLSPNDVNYLYYWLYANKSTLNSFGQGSTFMELPREKFAMLKISIPSEKEQTAIAHYLDTKLGEIDALIDKQQTLLEKLAEQRTAVITHAVTKGLNPTAPMKNSGVEWLGDVPAHWEVKRLRFTLNLNPVKSELNIPEDTLVSFIPMEAVNFDKDLTLTEERNLDEVYKGYTYFKNDDVVLAKITPCFENGKSAIAQNLTNGIAFGTTELHVLRPQDSINNHFLYYLIKSDSFMKIGESEMYGAGGQKRVPEEFIKNFLIGLPPYYEQVTIADYLDQETAKIDRLCDTVNQTIGRLKEYRTALITQAVTGKIKVTDE